MTRAPQKPAEPEGASPPRLAKDRSRSLDGCARNRRRARRWWCSQSPERADPQRSDAALCLFPLLSRTSREARTSRLAAASVTQENILDYVHYLESRVSSVTLAQSLYKIRRVAGCLDPGRDWRWLRRLCRRLDLRAKPRDRRNDVVEIKELFRLGRQLMDEADKADTSTAFREPCFIATA